MYSIKPWEIPCCSSDPDSVLFWKAVCLNLIRSVMFATAMSAIRGPRQCGMRCRAGRGKTDPSSTKSLRKYTKVFHSCAALLQAFCENSSAFFLLVFWQSTSMSMAARGRHLFKFLSWESKQIWANVWGHIFPAGSLRLCTRDGGDELQMPRAGLAGAFSWNVRFMSSAWEGNCILGELFWGVLSKQ